MPRRSTFALLLLAAYSMQASKSFIMLSSDTFETTFLMSSWALVNFFASPARKNTSGAMAK
jgi:hypothetical protein